MKPFTSIKGRRTNHCIAPLYLVMVFAIGCSTQETKLPASSESTTGTTAPSGTAAQDLSGLWVGTTSTGGLLGMPGLIRSIKIDLQQSGEKLTGTYSCYSGKASNSFCRNADEKGSVQGTARGDHVTLNIMLLPDASNCIYMGTLGYNGNGSYTCYLQGSIVEQGNWQLTRAYPTS